MEALKPALFMAQPLTPASLSPDPIAALRQELGSFTALDEDSEETWEGEWAPEELEARLAIYAAR